MFSFLFQLQKRWSCVLQPRLIHIEFRAKYDHREMRRSPNGLRYREDLRLFLDTILCSHQCCHIHLSCRFWVEKISEKQDTRPCQRFTFVTCGKPLQWTHSALCHTQYTLKINSPVERFLELWKTTVQTVT